MVVWILTEFHNDYNQHGDYFIQVWRDRPTVEQLVEVTDYNEEHCEWILKTGGGRRDVSYDVWYYLVPHEI